MVGRRLKDLDAAQLLASHAEGDTWRIDRRNDLEAVVVRASAPVARATPSLAEPPPLSLATCAAELCGRRQVRQKSNKAADATDCASSELLLVQAMTAPSGEAGDDSPSSLSV